MAKDDIARSELNLVQKFMNTGLCREGDFADVFVTAGQFQFPAILADEGLGEMALRIGAGGAQRIGRDAEVEQDFLGHGGS